MFIKNNDFLIYRTKIFIRSPTTLFRTEDAYQLKKHFIASIIQAKWKAILQRRAYLKMKDSCIVMQKWTRRYLAQLKAEKIRTATKTIRRFIQGFITRDGPVSDLNKKFVEIAKFQWLNRLSKSLPKSVLDKSWPACPKICDEASKILRKLYMMHMSRVYRLKLSPERKKQFELKILAEKILSGKIIKFYI